MSCEQISYKYAENITCVFIVRIKALIGKLFACIFVCTFSTHNVVY